MHTHTQHTHNTDKKKHFRKEYRSHAARTGLIMPITHVQLDHSTCMPQEHYMFCNIHILYVLYVLYSVSSKGLQPVVCGGVGGSSIGERFYESLVVLRVLRALHWSQDTPLMETWLHLHNSSHTHTNTWLKVQTYIHCMYYYECILHQKRIFMGTCLKFI